MVKIVRFGLPGRTSILTEEQKTFLNQDLTFIGIKELCLDFREKFKTFKDGSLVEARSDINLAQILKRHIKKNARK
jgi:hypothetical protein